MLSVQACTTLQHFATLQRPALMERDVKYDVPAWDHMMRLELHFKPTCNAWDTIKQ